MAFTAPCWSTLFGNSFLELAGTFRQRDPSFIRAVRDARVGNCSEAVEQLVQNCWVEGSEYQKKMDILHLMPRHKDFVRQIGSASPASHRVCRPRSSPPWTPWCWTPTGT